MNNNLTVYKASAGSGKTFTLAIEYLELIIRDTSAYRRILAVTFTNKATAEMKNRILSQLYGLANNLETSEPYKAVLKERNHDFSDKLIQERSAKALNSIIHDYSRFRIETIDSFFQRIMKQLAHELKLSASFNIELDAVKALDEAVDIMLEELHNNPKLLEVIINYIEEQLSNNKNWKIQSGIKKFAKHIFDETYARESSRPSGETIAKYKAFLSNKKDNETNKLNQYVTEFYSIINSAGLRVEDFNRKGSGPCGFFLKLEKGKIEEKDYSAKTYQDAKTDSQIWFSKTSKSANPAVASQLTDLICRADAQRIKSLNAINTVNLAIRDLNNLSLFEHISRTLIELNDRHNRFLLSDTNNLLREMIGKDDPSFIYEKIGTLIEHIMIDEFQDTSSMQWENFSKLLMEGLSQEKKSLIVGDVKQSIYRWRGGDWNILNSRLPRDIYPFGIDEKTLHTNRRSANNIIEFNNTLFPIIVENTGSPELNQAYSDVIQGIPSSKKRDEGYVKIVQFNKEGNKDYDKEQYAEDTIKALADEVRDLTENGLPMNDICILVRTKEPMPNIVKYFSEHLPEISLVSEEAFRMDASESIIATISVLKYLDSRDDSVSRVQIAMFCNRDRYDLNEILANSRIPASDFEDKFLPSELVERYDELHSMPLYELTENIMRILNVYDDKDSQAHVCFFLDNMKKFMQDEGADLESFLLYWDETLCSATIPGGSADGVKIMTIHKSKGLQAHTILIPFCDWKIIEDSYFKAPLIWCKPPEGYEYEGISIIPVTYNRNMGNSAFSQKYNEESVQMTVDNINLLYVALTRAEKNLIVYTKMSSRGADTIGDKIITALSHSNFNELKARIDNDWEFGQKIYSSEVKEDKEYENPIVSCPTPINIEMKHTTANVEFRQSNKSEKFQEGEDDEQQTYINKGVLMHQLFSSLTTGTEEEVETSLMRMEFDGLIKSIEEKEEMKKLALARIEAVRKTGWFDKENRLYNECKLLYLDQNGELEQAQPDRVIVRGNSITVIDFKFGKPKEEYAEQVKRYMNLLAHTHFKGIDSKETEIKGYLWYVYNNNIIEVK